MKKEEKITKCYKYNFKHYKLICLCINKIVLQRKITAEPVVSYTTGACCQLSATRSLQRYESLKIIYQPNYFKTRKVLPLCLKLLPLTIHLLKAKKERLCIQKVYLKFTISLPIVKRKKEKLRASSKLFFSFIIEENKKISRGISNTPLYCSQPKSLKARRTRALNPIFNKNEKHLKKIPNFF